jgi:hypothetical protein
LIINTEKTLLASNFRKPLFSPFFEIGLRRFLTTKTIDNQLVKSALTSFLQNREQKFG